jgi:hypothetical protein
LSDADGDTVITVEESADEDVIVVDTGDGVAGYPAQLNTLLLLLLSQQLMLQQQTVVEFL